MLSHFHADHTVGLRDFPNARILYKRDAYTAVNDLGLLASVKAGCLPGLLLDDFEEQSPFIDETPRRRLQYPQIRIIPSHCQEELLQQTGEEES